MFDHIKQKTINENKYQIELLPARKGLKLAMKLSQVILPTLGSSIDALDNTDGTGFTRVALLLVEQMDQFDVVELMDELLDNAVVNGKELDIDSHFIANYGELVEVLEFAVRENFESFFEAKGLKDRFSQMKAKIWQTAPVSEEPTD